MTSQQVCESTLPFERMNPENPDLHKHIKVTGLNQFEKVQFKAEHAWPTKCHKVS